METHPLLAERRRLGIVRSSTIEALSLVEAQRVLGARMRAPARAAIHARLAKTRPAALVSRLRAARESRAFLEARAAARLSVELRSAIDEYLACLSAWSRSVGAGAWLSRSLVFDGRPASVDDLVLWAQDDNTGCRTGMLRQGVPANVGTSSRSAMPRTTRTPDRLTPTHERLRERPGDARRSPCRTRRSSR
jgi:hypothetical protein